MAWIRQINPEQAEGLLSEVYDQIARERRWVANILRVQSLHAGALQHHVNLYIQLMFGPSPLSRAQREMIGVAVSRANVCEYCIAHHEQALQRAVRDADLIEEMRSAPANRTMLAYADKLTRQPAQVKEEDVKALRDSGLNDRAILHVAEITAYFNFVNRLASGLGVEIEPEIIE